MKAAAPTTQSANSLLFVAISSKDIVLRESEYFQWSGGRCVVALASLVAARTTLEWMRQTVESFGFRQSPFYSSPRVEDYLSANIIIQYYLYTADSRSTAVRSRHTRWRENHLKQQRNRHELCKHKAEEIWIWNRNMLPFTHFVKTNAYMYIQKNEKQNTSTVSEWGQATN